MKGKNGPFGTGTEVGEVQQPFPRQLGRDQTKPVQTSCEQFKNTSDILPTPVKVSKLKEWLSGYPVPKTNLLTNGFAKGFKVGYEGKPNCKVVNNLKSALDNSEVVDDYLQKELDSGRIDGPFEEVPFKTFQTSPIGVVPKKEPGKFRIIQHLS